MDKSFLLLFFKKEGLAFLACAIPVAQVAHNHVISVQKYPAVFFSK
jgi:hypothetical protein